MFSNNALVKDHESLVGSNIPVSMKLQRAQSVLNDLLHLFPEGWWFPVIQTDPTHGIATVFGRSRREVEVLLVNADVVRENARGLSLKKNPWDTSRSGEGSELDYDSTRYTCFAALVQPPGEPHHYKNKMCVDRVTLPSHLLEALKESTDSYNLKVAETN